MKNCFLVAVFWRDHRSVLSTLRVCNDGQVMDERQCRGLAIIVKDRMKRDGEHSYYPELSNQIEFVELYMVDADIINTMNTVELWHRGFPTAIATGTIVFVDNFPVGQQKT